MPGGPWPATNATCMACGRLMLDSSSFCHPNAPIHRLEGQPTQRQWSPVFAAYSVVSTSSMPRDRAYCSRVGSTMRSFGRAAARLERITSARAATRA